MASFLWFCLGIVIATIFWAVVIVVLGACKSKPILPFVMMRYSMPESLDRYRKEHLWAFVGWFYGV